MVLWHVIVLAIVQGLAELLPVSSSAHVIVAAKVMGEDMSTPTNTLLLVMLHTGTMFSVIAYFWNRWRKAFFQNAEDFKRFVVAIIVATFLTGVVGGGLIEGIEKFLLRGKSKAWVEDLFNRLDLIALALAAAGILILIAGIKEKRADGKVSNAERSDFSKACWIGAIQGLCLPFRGFSRSGATISTGMLVGVSKVRAEDFSFALAVVLTPIAIAREILRVVKTEHLHSLASLMPALSPSVFGAASSFLAGLLALKWLSRWLEAGRWYWFGIYCLLAAAGVGWFYFVVR
jgi:undecaprenyl-diphosphatase